MATAIPVLLLHGSVSSGAQWRALAERLSPRFCVLAPDLYGYGAAAGWSGRGAFSLGHEAAPLRALLEGLGELAHLVAHSYGGAVALHVARLHGRLLRSLTLIEPAAFHLLEDAAEISGVAGRMAEALVSGDYLGGMQGFVDYWNGAGAWQTIPPAKQSAMTSRLAKVLLDFHAAINDPARLPDFRALRMPALLLRGSRSPRPTRDLCEVLARTLPNARLETIEGAGHMCPFTHAEAVNTLVARALDQFQTREENDGSEENCMDFTGIGRGRLREPAGA